MFTNPRLIIDDSTKNSKLYPLSFGTNLIGRAPNCQVSIPHDKKISREHCALVITKENVHLIDLESGNGTFSKNQKIDKIALNWGDEFTIGLHHCIFVYDKKQNEVQADNSTSATLTHIPTRSLIQKSQSAGAVTTIGFQNTSINSLFYTLAFSLSDLTDLKSTIQEFIKISSQILFTENIFISFMGHEYSSNKDNAENVEFITKGKDILMQENSGVLHIPLREERGFCQFQRTTGFNTNEIEALTAVVYLLEEVCLNRLALRNTYWESISHRTINEIIGNHPLIKKINELINRIGDSSANVLITGPSGSGKEVVANALHKKFAGTSIKPFVAVNCAAISAALFESEFFGHVKGAFTNAHEDKSGYFEQAHGGTIFLDELGEMPIEFQSKLLRVIETGIIRPVGGIDNIQTNARIICATNKDLKALVAEGKFREDLFYRLQVVEIKMPALKDRKEDIPLLVDYFIKQLSIEFNTQKNLTTFGMREIIEYDWPGNIRELKNFLIKVLTLTETDEIDGNDVRKWIKKRSSTDIQLPAKVDVITLEEAEIKHIVLILKLTNNNKAEAAKILGITRSTLYEKIKKIPGLN